MTTYASAEEILEDLLPALRPERPLPVDEWADTYRKLDAGSSASPGQWSTDRVPYLREPMRIWTDPRLERLVLRFASQCGKTELLLNCLLRDMRYDPQPTLLVWQTERFARSTVKKRLHPTIAATGDIADRMTSGPDAIDIDINGATLYCRWAVDSEVKSRPIGRLYLDEIDEYPEGIVDLARERLKAWPGAKELDASTPTEVGVGIDAELDVSETHNLEWPCPHCGRYWTPTFLDLVWGGEWNGEQLPAGSACSPEQAERSARLVCRSCGGEIVDAHKPAMLAASVWVRDGEVVTIGPDGPVATGVDDDGAPIDPAEYQRPAVTVAGFALSSIFSPFVSFGKVVRAFANAGYKLTPKFCNGWLGEPWAPMGDRADEADLADVCRLSRYTRGRVTRDVLAITIGCDVQADRVYWEALGWTAGGETEILIDCGVLDAPQSEPIERSLRPMADWTWQRDDGVLLRPFIAGVDSGYRTLSVYNAARASSAWPFRILPTKGRDGAKMATPYVVKTLDTDPRGRRIPGGLQLLEINTDVFKGRTLELIRAAIDRARGRETLGRQMRLPRDTPADYQRQLVSEQRVRKRDLSQARQAKLASREAFVWQLRPGYPDNHYLDCRVICQALAERCNVRQLRSTRGAVIDAEPAPQRPAITPPDWRAVAASRRQRRRAP